ncbi:hypothetical protein [Nocardia sp.]|nr:hypothetical protein [Nocardia sp.]
MTLTPVVMSALFYSRSSGPVDTSQSRPAEERDDGTEASIERRR